jgi:hypothetical protein
MAASAPGNGSPSADAEPWLPARNRLRPGNRYGADTAMRHGDRVVTAESERVPVVELEPLARRASSPLFVHVAASASVPLVHRSLHRGRDPARRGGGLALRERLSRRLGPGEAAGFEPLELLGDGLLDDRGQVAVGHRGAHEGAQPLELVVKRGGSGELDLVAAWGEGLDHRGSGPGRGRQLCCFGRKKRDPGRGHSVRTQLELARGDSVRTQFGLGTGRRPLGGLLWPHPARPPRRTKRERARLALLRGPRPNRR